VGPVVDVGLFAALSVLGAYIAVVYGVGAMVTVLPIPRGWKRELSEPGTETENRPARHFGFQKSWFGVRWWIIVVGGAYALVAGIYASKVYFESNPFAFFPEGSPVTLSHDYLEKEVSGLSQLEIQIEGKKGQDLLKLKSLKDFEKLEEELLKNPNITKVISPSDFIKESLRSHSLGKVEAYKLPRRQSQLRQTLNGIVSESLKERLNNISRKETDTPRSRFACEHLARGSIRRCSIPFGRF